MKKLKPPIEGQSIYENEVHGSALTFEELREILPDLLRAIGFKAIRREVFEHGRATEISLRLEYENYEPEITRPEPFLRPEKMTHLKDPGEYRVCMGRKYYGLKLKDVPVKDMVDYLSWLEENANRKGVPVSEDARFLRVAFDRYRKFMAGRRK